MATIEKSDITGVVLAGGAGRRMGGVDKGLRLLRGKPLALWAGERLAPQVGGVLINANRNQARYAALGYPVINDSFTEEGGAGPLAGLHAALAASERPLLASVPCDSPFFPADLVAQLGAALAASAAPLVFAASRERRHPVFCLCRRSLLPDLAAALERGERRLAAWFAAVGGQAVDFGAPEAAFANINTDSELAALDAD